MKTKTIRLLLVNNYIRTQVHIILKKLGFDPKQRNGAKIKVFKSTISDGKAGVVIDIPLGKNAD